MNGYEIKARRHAREIVRDMRWRGMTVPPLYGRMADEFQELVTSGGYAAWVAANQRPTPSAGRSRVGGIPVLARPGRSTDTPATRGPRPASAGHAARPGHLLPGPVPGQ